MFKLACLLCDTATPPTLDDAVAEGWIGILADRDPKWSHLGYCPDCVEKTPKDFRGLAVLYPGALAGAAQ